MSSLAHGELIYSYDYGANAKRKNELRPVPRRQRRVQADIPTVQLTIEDARRAWGEARLARKGTEEGLAFLAIISAEPGIFL